ncbi:pentapeptide repeat-containing protein [Amycolatopsis sp. NPDC049868]|uniref:pentapeptide repeat-containing protein n=1 Tax=Amycolatopsis sp. NPDC049868 TaxID=3363934 RepID=UPI00378B8BA4
MDFSLAKTRVGISTFRRATFIGDARFDGATFTGDAWFGRATFTDTPQFNAVAFNGESSFDEATLHGKNFHPTAHRLNSDGPTNQGYAGSFLGRCALSGLSHEPTLGGMSGDGGRGLF